MTISRREAYNKNKATTVMAVENQEEKKKMMGQSQKELLEK